MRGLVSATIVFTAALAGCANEPTDRLILLPGANGKVGRVGVSASGAVPTVIDQAYGAATINPSGKIVQKTAERSEVQHDFGSTLDALPPRPISHTLYFENDSDILTSASAVEAQAILAEIAARPVADIVVIGHTDTMGDASYNDALSLQRAEKLRKLLIELGGDPRRISAAGRGERELLAPTSDEAPEPRNRRAEISVR